MVKVDEIRPIEGKDRVECAVVGGIRGAKSMIKIEKPLIVYEKPGVYTSEIYDIYGY